MPHSIHCTIHINTLAAGADKSNVDCTGAGEDLAALDDVVADVVIEL